MPPTSLSTMNAPGLNSTSTSSSETLHQPLLLRPPLPHNDASDFSVLSAVPPPIRITTKPSWATSASSRSSSDDDNNNIDLPPTPSTTTTTTTTTPSVHTARAQWLAGPHHHHPSDEELLLHPSGDPPPPIPRRSSQRRARSEQRRPQPSSSARWNFSYLHRVPPPAGAASSSSSLGQPDGSTTAAPLRAVYSNGSSSSSSDDSAVAYGGTVAYGGEGMGSGDVDGERGRLSSSTAPSRWSGEETYSHPTDSSTDIHAPSLSSLGWRPPTSSGSSGGGGGYGGGERSTGSLTRLFRHSYPAHPASRLQIEKRVSFDQQSAHLLPGSAGYVGGDGEAGEGEDGWTASSYDTSGLSVGEIHKLKKKGVNPALYAEMKAARRGRGKWVGPLVGNTYIG